ncbi:hypothetical protein GJ631_13475 [Natronomonas sp. CBA1123]|uniref:hypothetical protein n=1 Tax=Natronomonas sp. CBA1123 TaxID=2668070 RepID=UPI0012EA7B05|nr:hypothetical protein [Natronomonas sp. CBA1123]MUV87543.1 hypothetical protein [Natronomonas sp. CBA1123]
MRRESLQALSVVVAVAVFVGTGIAPVAAVGDGVDLGGENGIDVGTDGLNASIGGGDGASVEVGSNDGVDIGAGGEDGVDVGTDGVEVGGSNVTTDGFGEVEPSDDGVGTSQVDFGSGDTPELTDVEFDSKEDIPKNAQVLRLLLRSIPEINRTGPEDFPIGDERAALNVCDPLDVEPGDLPLELLPSLQDVPEPLQVPGVPSTILSNEALAGILLGLIPAPCEVFNPNDPQIDPTDVPDEPRGQFDIQRAGAYEYNGSQGGVILVDGSGTLNESADGPRTDVKVGALATQDFGDFDTELTFNDGKNDYGVERLRARYNDDGVKLRLVLSLVDKQAGVDLSCDSSPDEAVLEEAFAKDLDQLQENPLAPCEIEFIGLPQTLLDPGLVFQILAGLSETATNPGG